MLEKAQILLVSDLLAVTDPVCTVLETAGYLVSIVAGSEEALKQIGVNRPDLILLNIRLPDSDGYELCQRIKADHASKDIPIILILAEGKSFDRSAGFMLGAADYIMTPIEPEELRVRVRAQLDLVCLRRELSLTRSLLSEELSRNGLEQDMSERKQTEAALRESEMRFRQIAENTQQVFWMTGPGKDEMLYISPAYETIWGCSCDSLYASPMDWMEAIIPEDRERVRQAAFKQMTGSYDEEYRIKRSDGSVRWIWDRAFPVLDEAGEVYRIVGIADDITKYKQMEDEVKQSQANLSTLVESIDDPLWSVDRQKRLLTFNTVVANYFKRVYNVQLQPGMTINEILPPDRAAFWSQLYERVLAGEKITQEYEAYDGQFLEISLHPIIKEERVTGVAVFGKDITAYRLAEQALRQSQQRYEELVNTIDGIVWIADARTFHFHFVSQQAERLLGYPVSRWLDEPTFWQDHIHPDDREKALQYCQQATIARESHEFEYRMLASDGRPVWLRDLVTVISTDDAAVELRGVMVDVTAQKRTEAEIHRRNRELTLLNQVITASAAGMNPEAVLNIACRELALTFELVHVTAVLLNEQETEITVVAEHVVGDHRPRLLDQTYTVEGIDLLREMFRQPAPLFIENVFDEPQLAPFQEVLCQMDIVSLLVLPLVVEGAIGGTLNLGCAEAYHFSDEEIELARNVAGQVAGSLARSRLSQTRHRLLTAIEQAPESVVITDIDGVILYVNPAFEQITGFSRSEAIGQNPRMLKSGKQDAAFYKKLWATISAGKVWQGRLVNRKKDGSLYTEEAIITPVRDERGIVVNYVALQRDVTRELQLEEQYRQAQKMEAIGRLAGGVAHDFNNMLTAIMGYTGLSLQTLSDSDPTRADIESIQKTAERAADLTRQLLTFARKQVIHPVLLDPNDLILNLSKMLRRLIGEDIELVILPGSELGYVKADPGQLEQVILNLVVNARDAMPGGGKLMLTTARVTIGEAEARRHTELAPGDYVQLTVSDTGVGMTEAVQARIFEPFFTTKSEGKGTGLGLATAFGIVKQNNGHIWCESEPDRGSTFRIVLPHLTRVGDPPNRTLQHHPLPRGTETVLIVEDEPAVRELMGRMLSEQGYQLLEATSGTEALLLAQEYSQEIDLLLTDVIMPGISGKLLAERLRALRPHLRVLFISGYTDDIIVHHGVPGDDIHFLQKPFTPRTLISRVRQVLDAPRHPL